MARETVYQARDPQVLVLVDYRPDPGAIRFESLQAAHAVEGIPATITPTPTRSPTATRTPTPSPTTVVVPKTKGMTEAEAFRRIQKLSMNYRKPMREVAEAIILAYQTQQQSPV